MQPAPAHQNMSANARTERRVTTFLTALITMRILRCVFQCVEDSLNELPSNVTTITFLSNDSVPNWSAGIPARMSQKKALSILTRALRAGMPG
jgi:hypothetical protein